MGTDWRVFLCDSSFFFGGLSIHLSTAILAHLFSYNMWVHFFEKVSRDFELTFRSLGHGDRRVKKSRNRRSGLKVRDPAPVI